MYTGAKLISYGSEEQLESLELRRKILREPLGLEFIENDLEDDMNQIHVASYRQGELAGILLLKKIGDATVKMRQVAVWEKYRRMGVGKEIVLAAEAWCNENNFKRIELNARKTAIDFYISLGYTVTGDEFLEVDIPHKKMFKVVSPK